MSTTTQTETTSQKVAIVLGATGETGSQALLSALASPSISRVISLGRRAPTLPPSVQESKFQHVNVDFEKLLAQDAAEQNKLKDAGRAADVVICALGTTRAAAGGMEGFVKIDREYVLEACKQARVDGKDQRLAYCSVRSLAIFFLELRADLGRASIGYRSLQLCLVPLFQVKGVDRGGAGRSGLLRDDHVPPRYARCARWTQGAPSP